MRHKQVQPRPLRINLQYVKRKNRSYSPTALTNAYKHVIEKKDISVRRASIIYGVPETTLRDRVLGNVHPDTISASQSPLFDNYEEANLVKHFETMAKYGYGYTRQESVDIATDYAVILGKRSKDRPLTLKWFRGFLKRWPEMKVHSPRALEFVRAKMASAKTVSDYFDNLKSTLIKHDLIDKPHLIFNVDEKGISTNHKPPHIVANASYCPPAVTSGKDQTVTFLGCGSAAGQTIPPYFVFPGMRMRQELLSGATPGADGTVSLTGWSNGVIFRQYLEHHFLKFISGRNGQKILLIVDGHKSHVSVGLCEWAQQIGIILFILPAHTSHLLQPMDVACYGPFSTMYHNRIHKLIKQTSARVTIYNICQVACQVYNKALSTENIQSGFSRGGIFPFNADAVPAENFLPAEVYRVHDSTSINENDDTDTDSQKTVEGGIDVVTQNAMDDEVTVSDTEYVCDINSITLFEDKENQLRKIKSEHKTKERNTMSKIIAGKEITEEIVQKMKDHELNQKKNKKTKERQTKTTKPKKTKSVKSFAKQSKQITMNRSPQPGPSHINLLSDHADSEDDSEICDKNDLCCVCNKFTPEAVRCSTSLIFVKWGQCDSCQHWVHLIYCSPVRVIRRGDLFHCPHCVN